jgi:hypothetical protein
MDVYITESNIRCGDSFHSTTNTTDTPSEFTAFARMLINYAKSDPDPDNFSQASFKNISIAKLQQAGYDKKGLHFISLTGQTNGQIGGVSNMGEVLRLFAQGFKQNRFRISISSNDSQVKGLGALDFGTSAFYVITVNGGASARTVSLNMSALNFLPSSPYILMDSVTPERRGNATVVQSSGRVVSFSQPAQSVTLLTIPFYGSKSDGGNVRQDILATDDATVKGGGNRWTNYGSSTSLYAANSATSAAGRNVSFIAVPLTDINPDSMQFAMLRVYGQAKTTDGYEGQEVITHVYGLDGDNADTWGESSITGANAPNLSRASDSTFLTGSVNRIDHSFVTERGLTAHFLGHLTGRNSADYLGIDVSNFIRQHIGPWATFLITREIRRDPYQDCAVNPLTCISPDTLTDENRSLWMASSENSTASARPRLIVVH